MAANMTSVVSVEPGGFAFDVVVWDSAHVRRVTVARKRRATDAEKLAGQLRRVLATWAPADEGGV